MIHKHPTWNKQTSFVLLILIILNFGCATVSSTAFGTGAFWYMPKPTDKRSYVLMKDSTIVYGKKVVAPIGPLAKKEVRVDGRGIPITEILGFQDKGYYYKRLDESYASYAKQLVRGPINVYEKRVGADKPQFFALYQKGANGELVTVNSTEQLREMLRDCPKAYDMLNKSSKELDKIDRKQPDYLYTVIQTYNSCSTQQ